MFSCCCKSKKVISQEDKLLNDMLIMDEEIDLIFPDQNEHDEFDLKLGLLDKKYIEEQRRLIQKRQIQEEKSELEQNKETQNEKVTARRILRMADYVKNNNTQSGISGISL